MTIFEIIKNCLDNNTFTINDSNDYLTLLLTYKELIKISITIYPECKIEILSYVFS